MRRLLKFFPVLQNICCDTQPFRETLLCVTWKLINVLPVTIGVNAILWDKIISDNNIIGACIMI